MTTEDAFLQLSQRPNAMLMTTKLKFLTLSVFALCLAAPGALAAPAFGFGSGGWKYRLGSAEASTPTNAWRAIVFDDSSWTAGATGPIGFDNNNTPGTTVPTIATPAGATGLMSIYFRRTFVVDDLSPILSAFVQVEADDGLIVWVNGVEVGRANVAAAPAELGFGGPATAATTPEINTVSSASILGLLVEGTNVLAVHAFNVNNTSSDLVMDGSLVVTEDTAPVVDSVFPLAASTVTSLGSASVIFNENVTGVDAGDLTVNGAAATGLLVVSPREYQFSFAQPATGTVSFAVAPGGIMDLDGTATAFGGYNWNCILNTNAPPSVLRINEFMADNEHNLEDEDGGRSDWIEIYNPGPADANLGGWSLTDTSTNLTKWRFPSISLGANKYLIVFASGKNRISPSGPFLHTNFELNEAGSYLALVDPTTNVVSSFGSAYPVQATDMSYGQADAFTQGYFLTPTPGAQNASSGPGFAESPVFSLESGVYTNNSLTLTVTGPPGSIIRYTVNGTEPTASSASSPTPLSYTFTTNLIIKARVYQANNPSLLPGPILGRQFILLESSVANFSSDLPIVIFNTQGAIPRNLPPGAARPRGQFVSFDTIRGRASLQGPVDHQGFAAYEIVGQTSADFLKQPFRAELNDEYGNDMKAPLLGLPSEADWNFRNPYNDKTLLNDFLGYELWEDMGHYSCRRRLVELFIDTGGAAAAGKLNYPGDYYGVMVLFERIERSKERVNISELTRFHTNEPSITGGFIFKKDKDSVGDINFTTGGGGGFGGQTLKLHEPKPNSMRTAQGVTTTWPGAGYLPHASNQLSYLMSYLNRFESSMYAANWTNATGTNHYSHYIDVDAFVDQQLHVEFTKQIDGYRLSGYYSKDRNGKLRPDPVWDWNLSFGNAYYLRGGTTNGWYWSRSEEGMNNGEHIWLRRLVFGTPSGPNSTMAPGAGSGDADFRQKITDRWAVLRTNVLNGDRVVGRITNLAARLTEAAGRNYGTKYTTLLASEQWPNPNGAFNGTQPPTEGWHINFASLSSYPAAISNMTRWVKGRYLWMDSQFLGAPASSQSPGPITPGTQVTLGAQAGTIYYTLNGTDPRLAGGGISPSAVVYSGPITINANSRLFARSYVPGQSFWTTWSAPLDQTFVVQTPRFVVTEIMYHPLPPAAGSPYTNAVDFEYIELRNAGGTSLTITGARLTGGIEFTFPAMTLLAGQRVLVVGNGAAFSSRYNTNGLLIAGQYTGTLANEGNRLVVLGPLAEPVLDFSYNNSWYPVTDGLGFSLVINNDAAAFNTWGLAASWRASGSLNGSPGLDNGAPPSFPQVVINEVLTHSDTPPPTDTIELRNLSGTEAVIGGWFLTDDRNSPKKFRIPPGTTIAGNSYRTFTEADFNSGANGNTAFALSSMGDEVYLYSGDATTNLTGYLHGFDYGAQYNGRTFGRHLISSGEDHFVAMSSATLGGANTGPLVGPVVISEVHYHPVDFVNQYGTFDNSEDEYIELHNISGGTVLLHDPANPGNLWRLRDAVEFTFPAGTNLPANGYALVVSFDPANAAALASFRANNGVPANVPVFGPFSGQLDNSTDSIELVAPDAPTNTIVPYVLIDKVRYTDTAPWPAGADGIGLSLQRTVESSYGNDVTNWVAGGRSPGASYVFGPPPVITTQPQSIAAPATYAVTLSVRASGTPPLSYQWRFRPSGGSSFSPIQGATSSNLVFNYLQVSDSGAYDCVVANTAGSVTSSNAILTVFVPATISTHPTNLTVRIRPDPAAAPSTSAVFRAFASTDNPPLSYRWQFNGMDIPLDATNHFGVTESILTISNITLAQGGVYRCAVSDAIATVYSSNAVLLAGSAAYFVQIPGTNMTAPVNSTLTLGASVQGVPSLPNTFFWRSGSTLVRAFTTMATNDYVTFTTPANPTTLNYRIEVSNAFYITYYTTSAYNRVFINTMIQADSDADGIPDVVEAQFPGGTAAPGDDADGDGMTNLAEYRAGTDPLNAASYLKIESFSLAPSTLTFGAISNRTYTIRYSHEASGPWTKLTDVLSLPYNRVETITDSGSSTQRIYQVVTPRQP